MMPQAHPLPGFRGEGWIVQRGSDDRAETTSPPTLLVAHAPHHPGGRGGPGHRDHRTSLRGEPSGRDHGRKPGLNVQRHRGYAGSDPVRTVQRHPDALAGRGLSRARPDGHDRILRDVEKDIPRVPLAGRNRRAPGGGFMFRMLKYSRTPATPWRWPSPPPSTDPEASSRAW
jgi:hypothetical protein